MLDIGWSELMIVAVVTLVVVGPSEIPRVLRTVRGVIAKIRGLTSEFQNTLEQAAREADMADLKKQLMSEKNEYDQTKDSLFNQILYDDTVRSTEKEIEGFAKSTVSAVSAVSAASKMQESSNTGNTGDAVGSASVSDAADVSTKDSITDAASDPRDDQTSVPEAR